MAFNSLVELLLDDDGHDPFLLYTARSEVPQQLVRARKVKQAGVTASLTILGSSLVLLRYSDIQIPKLPPSAWPAALLALGLTFTSGLIITARELLQDRLVIELHNGRLYIQSGLTPRNGLSVPRDAIVVSGSLSKFIPLASIPLGFCQWILLCFWAAFFV